MTKLKPKVSFLFGSGISLDLGLPSTSQITDVVLSGLQAANDKERKVYKGSTRQFYLASKNDDSFQPQDEDSSQLIELIVSFLNKCSSYFPNPNYEQIYEIVYQIQRHFLEGGQNPVMDKFIKSIQPLLSQQISLYNQIKTFPELVLDLQELCSKSIDYIEDIVHQLISEGGQNLENADFSHFDWLNKSIKNYQVQQITTLNHDLVLENFFKNNGISYTTGFEKNEDTKSATYQFNWATKDKLPLLKLHGSLDWNAFQSVGKIQIKYRDLRNVDYINGRLQLPNGDTDTSEMMQDWHSMKVMGTESKLIKYSQSVYPDLFHHFIEYLKNSDYLVIAGYSFGDQAVNDYIYEQMMLNPKLKIVVIHPNKNSIANNSKILNHTDNLIFIEKAICKVDEGQDKCHLGRSQLTWTDFEAVLM